MATREESFRDNIKDRLRLNGPYMTPEQACRQVDQAYKQYIDPAYPVPKIPPRPETERLSEAGRTLNKARRRNRPGA